MYKYEMPLPLSGLAFNSVKLVLMRFGLFSDYLTGKRFIIIYEKKFIIFATAKFYILCYYVQYDLISKAIYDLFFKK